MRKSGLLILAFLIVQATPTFGQSISGWMSETSPTARVWGMGNAGGASTSSLPALYSPGTLGLWAFNGMHASYTHSSRSLRHALSSDPGFSNDMQALALNMPLRKKMVYPRVSLGVMHRTGSTERFAQRHDYQDWSLGVGVDVGFELGMGWNYNKQSAQTSASVYDWDREFGFAVRFRPNHVLQRFGAQQNPLDQGRYQINPSATFATNDHYLNKTSWAFAIGVTRDDLPLADIEFVIDNPEETAGIECTVFDRRRYGWEMVVLGTVAYRWGSRDQEQFGGFECDPLADWSTEGWMVDITNAQRWARHVANLRVSPSVAWILDHLQARYEQASYRRPETVPSEIGEAGVHEWTLGLTHVIW